MFSLADLLKLGQDGRILDFDACLSLLLRMRESHLVHSSFHTIYIQNKTILTHTILILTKITVIIIFAMIEQPNRGSIKEKTEIISGYQLNTNVLIQLC